MIPSGDFDAFMQYIGSVDLPERSKGEVERFISEAIDLPASSAERIREAFANLRTIFSRETLWAAPDLQTRVNLLEIVSINASRAAAAAHDQLANEAPQAEPAADPERPSSPPAPAPQAEAKPAANFDLPSPPAPAPQAEAEPAAGLERPSSPPAPAPQAEAEHESSDSEVDMPRRRAKRKESEHVEEPPRKRRANQEAPAAAEAEQESLRASLARVQSFLSRAHSGAQNHLPFLAGDEIFAIWASRTPGVGLIINVQKSDDFSSGASQANKLSFTLGRFGNLLSVWENGQDTHGVILPEKWGPLVQAAVKALDELYRGN